MAIWNQINFQEAASPLMIYMLHFYDHGMLILTLIISFVGVGLFSIIYGKSQSRYLADAQLVELIWTSFPALILISLAVPSLRLLYLMDEMMAPSCTVKVIGHQWYWSYEYPNNPQKLMFDSYMSSDLSMGEFRLLEVDNRLVLPMGQEIRVLVSSLDVIHSWTIPSLGVKMDAVPGRSNQLLIYSTRCGVFYGQCSEICGANHSFMPVCIEMLPVNWFKQWLNFNK